MPIESSEKSVIIENLKHEIIRSSDSFKSQLEVQLGRLDLMTEDELAVFAEATAEASAKFANTMARIELEK